MYKVEFYEGYTTIIGSTVTVKNRLKMCATVVHLDALDVINKKLTKGTYKAKNFKITVM
jgi:hypothetical protein